MARAPRRKKTYFISDAHLGLGSRAEDRAREDRLVRFLEFIRHDAAKLFVVGDLFDYWFEYKTVVPKGYVRLLGKLAEMTDGGVGITYLAGNHDFWLKDYFQNELGIEVCPEPIERTIDGRRFLLHHGDGLLKNDTGYRILKKVLRSKINIFLFSLLHPDLTGRVARWSSRTSRHHTSKQSYEEQDMVEFAGRNISAGCSVVVMGHNHAPRFERIGSGIYINLGEWIDGNTYASFDGTAVSLNRWLGNSSRTLHTATVHGRPV